MKKLVALTFTESGDLNPAVAALVLENLTRSQLKSYLAALRRELRRRRVYVALSGGSEAEVGGEIGGRYPDRELAIRRDDALAGGVKVSAGDDIVDASVTGYLKELLGKIGHES
ncbi:MAG TPA: F0F1 ATP synthase subunit delta [Spirochaetia bacterium]|nr:F0F1 ATP synthase subunit delta [Spirochaetia bacterium]